MPFMGRIEKTVFLSYRRADQGWAQAIFGDLTQHGYDVFIDYDGIASGNFEAIILENIRARAHFLALLTPTALDRRDTSKDWMRREIEAALDSRRNIVPLMLEGFNFGEANIAGHLTGKLEELPKYNGLEIPKGYFSSAMERLRTRYLNVPVDTVLHLASVRAQQVATEQKEQATRAKRELPVEKPGKAPILLAMFQEENGAPTVKKQEESGAGGKTCNLPELNIDLWLEQVPEETTRVRFEIPDKAFKDRIWWSQRDPTERREFLCTEMWSYGDIDIWADGYGAGTERWSSECRLYKALARYYRGRPKSAGVREALKQIREN
jgi:hypothetical protein